jgi:hypothetical protein
MAGVSYKHSAIISNLHRRIGIYTANWHNLRFS